jgi:hypothetical protein
MIPGSTKWSLVASFFERKKNQCGRFVFLIICPAPAPQAFHDQNLRHVETHSTLESGASNRQINLKLAGKYQEGGYMFCYAGPFFTIAAAAAGCHLAEIERGCCHQH